MIDLWTLALIILLLLFLSVPQLLERVFLPVIYILYLPIFTIFTGLARFWRNLPEIVALIVISIISLLVWFVTSIVHSLGRFRTENALAELLERAIGYENITRIRKDLLSILSSREESKDHNEVSDLNRLREDTKSKMQSGELIFTVFFGVLIMLVPSFFERQFIIDIPIGTAVQIYVVLMTIAVLIRIHLVDVLAFSSKEEAEEFGIEESMAWQKAVTKSGLIPILSVILSFFVKTRENTYQNALEILELRLKQEIPIRRGIKLVYFN